MVFIKKNLLSIALFSVCIILICVGFIVFRASAASTGVANYSETWTATGGIYASTHAQYYGPPGPNAYWTYTPYYYTGFPTNGSTTCAIDWSASAAASFDTGAPVSCSTTVTSWSVTGSVSSPQ